MKLWSSIHFFTEQNEKAINYCSLDIRDRQDECRAIQTYFDNFFSLRQEDLDAIPMHDNDRYFASLFTAKYHTWVPSWVICQDFAKEGLPLNLYGDIIKSAQGISVYSSRYCGGTELKGVMSHAVCAMSTDLRCPVLNCTFMQLEEETVFKIYVSQGRRYAVIRRSTLPQNRADINCGLLYEVFPVLENSGLLEESDPSAFSQNLCAFLGLIDGGENYVRQRQQETVYIKTENLYSIYERKSEERR